MIIASYNVEKAADLLHIDSLLARSIQSAPRFVSLVDPLITNKWVFAGSTFILGMFFADYLIRRSLRAEASDGFWSDLWVTYKKLMTVMTLREWRPFRWLIDLGYELRTLDSALQRRALPPLPTTDPTNHEGLRLTRRYLEAIGSIRASNIGEARERAQAIIAACTPTPPPLRQDVPVNGMRKRLRNAVLAFLEDGR